MVWHLDRLHRRPIELEAFVQTCAAAGVTNVVTLHGDFNLGSGDGLLVARLLGAVAADESDAKIRRGKRKAPEVAKAGKPHMGGSRPFAVPNRRSEAEEPRLRSRTLGRATTSIGSTASAPRHCRRHE
ncbi:MAG: recombinase family protein [Actinomycetota bacterium]|nr:recombinase family protein [Actinomycetota bacterium]